MSSFYDQALAFLYAAILAAVPLLYGTWGKSSPRRRATSTWAWRA